MNVITLFCLTALVIISTFFINGRIHNKTIKIKVSIIGSILGVTPYIVLFLWMSFQSYTVRSLSIEVSELTKLNQNITQTELFRSVDDDLKKIKTIAYSINSNEYGETVDVVVKAKVSPVDYISLGTYTIKFTIKQNL